MMKRIAFFDTKIYDKEYFAPYENRYDIKYFENKLSADTCSLAAGYDGVVAFVNDDISADVIDSLYEGGVRVIALRSAGYNNVDMKAAFGKINLLRVPAYSPNAVAEHAFALLLGLNRKIHKAYNRTRDFDFRLAGLVGTNLEGKTAGIVGTGKIGMCFASICKGLSMKIKAYDPYPNHENGLEYCSLDELLSESDVVSLHCPLTKETYHLLDSERISMMKRGSVVINTSRGQLIDTKALLTALQEKKLGGAGLDVYEEEEDFFFEDFSQTGINDDVFSLLVTLPNVLVTSHQGFLTAEALQSIAKTTIENLDAFFEGKDLKNEICYQCGNKQSGGGPCEDRKTNKGRCF